MSELIERSFDELTFTDNLIFTNVLISNPDLCIELVELVTGKKVDGMKLETLGKEHTVEQTPDAKGIRLDVYFEDAEAMYDLEMQTTKEPDLPKRFRYYQGMMDIANLGKGNDYGDLKQSIIVFLCTFDAFSAGRVKYEFQNLCIDDPTLVLGDESKKIAICAYGKTVKDNDVLNDLLSYMQGNKPENSFVKRLDKAVQEVKKSSELRRQYMSYEMDRLRYGKKEKAIGKEEGRTEGIAEGRFEQLIELVEDETITVEKAAEKAKMSVEDFVKKMEEIEAE